jgi:hypothetical protein
MRVLRRLYRIFRRPECREGGSEDDLLTRVLTKLRDADREYIRKHTSY